VGSEMCIRDRSRTTNFYGKKFQKKNIIFIININSTYIIIKIKDTYVNRILIYIQY
jgi:hypothetical protein